MSTLATKLPTLVDYAKLVDPGTNSITTTIAELLSQRNEVLLDAVVKEGNLPTGHRVIVRTGLPDVVWRKLNSGVPSSKATTAQVDEACGMLEAICEIDKDLADLNGTSNAFRMSQNAAFLEAMSQEMAYTLFYGDHTINPEEFLGFAPRYNTLNTATAASAANVITGGGSQSDNTSIWFIGWGMDTCHLIFPKGSKAGLIHTPGKGGAGDGAEWAFDSAGNRYRAYIDHYQWKVGLAIPDWRFVVRIPNIDVSNIATDTNAADLIKLMTKALFRLPRLSGDVKPVFYANRTVHSALAIQALNKSQNALSVQEALGQFGQPLQTVKFMGYPVRIVDVLSNGETVVA